MFGDDLNPTVMIERVRFGEVLETREGGSGNCVERVKRLDDKRMVGLRKINRGDEEAATTNGPRVL